MGRKPNWGRGLQALGQGLGDYYQMQRQDQLRQEEIERQEQMQADLWERQDIRYGQAQADKRAFRDEGWAHDIEQAQLAELYKDEPAPIQYVPPVNMQQPQGPSVSGGPLPMTSGSPVDDVIGGMQRYGGVTPEAAQAVAKSMGMAGATQQSKARNVKPPAPTVDFQLDESMGGGKYPVSPADYPALAMRQAGMLDNSTEDPVMTPNAAWNAAGDLREAYLPREKTKTVWNKDLEDWEEVAIASSGGLLTPDEQNQIGPKAYAELQRAIEAAYVSQPLLLDADNATKDRIADAIMMGIDEDDIDLDSALADIFGTENAAGYRYDDAGTKDDTSDDRVIIPNPDWRYADKVYSIAEARDKIMETANAENRVSWAKHNKILKEFGLEELEYKGAVGSIPKGLKRPDETISGETVNVNDFLGGVK